MKFTSIANEFSVFGNFAVFDDDNIGIINKLFSDCNIAINQEPNNPQNKAGKVLQITDPKNKMTITMRPYRITVQAIGFQKADKNVYLNQVLDVYKGLAAIFENCDGNRISYVSNSFVFDDNGENMQTIASHIDILPFNNPPSEVNLRINEIHNILGEDMNVVLIMQNAMIGSNANPSMGRRRSIVVTFDINTIVSNDEQRFDLANLGDFFSEMYDVAQEKIEHIATLR